MSTPVVTLRYDQPPFDRGEILRYMRCREPSEEVEALLDACIDTVRPHLELRVCHREFPVTVVGDTVDLSFVRLDSRGLAMNLAGCRSAVVFAATVGLALDRLIARAGRRSPARGLCYQAIGAERIEALCDLFNAEVTARAQAEGMTTRTRFSPGYGDLPLELQRDIFAVLDCPRRIGLTLNESLLMSPSKSVTAIIGMSDQTTL